MNIEFHPEFPEQFEALVEKFAELVVGDTSPETVEQIKLWAVYNHIHKSMPALTSHWNQNHPEGKADVRKLFEAVRDMNQELKERHKASAPSPE
jgi:hypothetical protein